MPVRKMLLVLLGLALLVSLAIVPGCGPGETEDTTPTETEAPEVEAPAIDEVAEITDAANSYLSSEFAKVWIVNPADIKEKLDAGDDSFQLIDLRQPQHYANGHIEGAVNIPFETIANEDSLAKLDPDKTQLLIDYDGSESTPAHMLLAQLEYDVLTLRFGMSGWTTEASISTPDGSAVWDGQGKDYPLSTDAVAASGPFDPPVVNTGAADRREAILNGAKAFFATGGAEKITADELKAMLDAGATDIQLVSMRNPEHYEFGHIGDAINIPYLQIATEESLSKLDPSKRIVIYCYQGHAGGLAQMYLSQLGYDAVNLAYGIGSWINDENIRAVPMYDPAKVGNFPTVTE